MKRICLILLSVLALAGCAGGGDPLPDDADGVFRGRLTVGDYTRDATIFVTENVGNSTVDIFFDNVKFAPLMPVVIDITVKGVPCRNDGVLSFSTVDVDPYINKEVDPQPGYRFSEISGVVDGDELVLSARMADGLAWYVEGKVFSFSGSLQ